MASIISEASNMSDFESDMHENMKHKLGIVYKLIRKSRIDAKSDAQLLEVAQLQQVADIVVDLLNDTTGKIPVAHVQLIGKSKDELLNRSKSKYKSDKILAAEVLALNLDPSFDPALVKTLADVPDAWIVAYVLRPISSVPIPDEVIEKICMKSNRPFRVMMYYFTGCYIYIYINVYINIHLCMFMFIIIYIYILIYIYIYISYLCV